jgi:hypothetical protein
MYIFFTSMCFSSLFPYSMLFFLKWRKEGFTFSKIVSTIVVLEVLSIVLYLTLANAMK